MKIISQISQAQQFLREGKIIAYPTEAVYGLGCDPFNKSAVETLLALKQRPVDKGLIILIADWLQLNALIAPISDCRLEQVSATWPGPVTWVFPKSADIPSWVTGEQTTVAIRMSAHPIAHALCEHGPIVSTSANLSGQLPARDLSALSSQFPQGVDAVLLGDLGGYGSPSAIYEVLSGKRLR